MANPLSPFWRSLSDCHQPPAHYLGRALLADLPVTVAIAVLLNAVTGTTWPEFSTDTLPRVLVAMCVFAPVVETFGMAVILWMLRRFLNRPEYLPLATALICAGLHSLAKPLWGLEIFWAFLIFARCYATWEKKSPLRAFWLTALLHALHNLVPLLFLAAARAMSGLG